MANKILLAISIVIFCNATALANQDINDPDPTEQIQEVSHPHAFVHTIRTYYINELLHNKWSPVMGNRDSNINVVEFSDYQCGHCKKMTTTIEKLINRDPNIRVVFKNFVIFGNNSALAAKMGLYANTQGRFDKYNYLLMQHPDRINADDVMQAATKSGLNVNAANQFIAQHDNEINTYLRNNAALAEKIGLQGTPAFIIINEKNEKIKVIPRATNLTTLLAAISSVN
jgi:protein-disulfide isomerase